MDTTSGDGAPAADPRRWAAHTAYSDPGALVGRYDGVPADVPAVTAVVRNLVSHYRASGETFDEEHLADIDLRWVEDILRTDRSRHPEPVAVPRTPAERVAGCCRDFTLLTVSLLRHHAVPTRSRVGFADYLGLPDWHFDHVVVDWWDGERWVRADAQADPARSWPVDVADLPRGTGFETAAEVWTAYRRDGRDLSTYGVAPGHPAAGPWFVRNYVLMELAHRCGDELLLWDAWGIGDDRLVGDEDRIDGLASLLLAADDGDGSAEAELRTAYAGSADLHPGDEVLCLSPRGVTRTDRLR